MLYSAFGLPEGVPKHLQLHRNYKDDTPSQITITRRMALMKRCLGALFLVVISEITLGRSPYHLSHRCSKQVFKPGIERWLDLDVAEHIWRMGKLQRGRHDQMGILHKPITAAAPGLKAHGETFQRVPGADPLRHKPCS